MSWTQLVDQLVSDCEAELGDQVTITDGAATVQDCPGFFRRQWDESLEDRFGFTQELPTFECKLSRLIPLDLTKVGSALKLTFQELAPGDWGQFAFLPIRDYTVMDLRYDSHVSVLLVLMR